MKNFYLLRILLKILVLAPGLISAQCPISIDAGADIYVCDIPQQFHLNGSINGEYLDIKWSPTTGLIATSDPLSPLATITNSIQYALTVRHLDETTNLIQNGDFEQGNTDFVSNYDYSPGDLLLAGTYDVLPDPESANPGFPPCNDHTTGSGNMLALNAAGSYSTKAWCQNVPVTPFSDYAWSFWVMTLSGIPRTLVLEGASPVKSYITPDSPCVWIKVTKIFNSGNKSTLPLCITSFPPPSNLPPFAFALDDIVLNPICKVTDTVNIKLENVIAKAFPDAYVIPCTGKEVTLSGIGSSTGPVYSYNWETPDGNIVSGQNTLQPVVNAPGTYTLTVMLDNGIGDCVKTASVEVTESNLLQVSVTAPPTLSCNAGTPLFGASTQPGLSSYLWTAGPGGHIVSGHIFPIAYVDQPGEYTLLVTNITNGCTAETSVNIAPPILPVAIATAPAITCAAPQTTLSGAGSATGPAFSYAWTAISGHIASGKDSLYAVADTVGTYVLQVSNTGSNCSKTDTVVVTANNTPLPVLILPADTLTCLQKSVVLATDSSTARTHSVYVWTASSGGNIVNGADSLSPVVNAPGMYVLMVTDTLNGCSGTDTVAVLADNDAVIAIANAPAGLTCTNTLVALDATGSSPDPTFLYEWSTTDGHIVSGGNTPSPLVDAPGLYLLQLTNPANGCLAVDAATVTLDVNVPDLHLSVSGTLHCNTDSVSLLNTTTTDPSLLGYNWTFPDGTSVSTGAAPGLDVNAPGPYSVLATNSQNGCTASASIVVEQQGAVSVTLVAQQNNACFGDTDGSLNILAAGGDGNYTYLWSNDATTPAISGLAAGAYTATVSDGEGCTAAYSATIIEPAELFAYASATSPTTFGASDGTTTANPQGGTPGYTFAWNTGSNDQTLSGLPAGFYTVTVTDINHCSAVQMVEVWSGNCNLIADFQQVDPLCHGAANGQATITPAGGTGPYTYAWSSGSTEQTATGLSAGTYGVTLTDANGCPFSGTVALGEPPLLTLSVQNVIDAVCPNSAEGSITVLAGGGTGISTIAWSNGQNGPEATALPAGVYVATATDTNGCTAQVIANVNAVDLEAPQIMAGPVDLPIGPSGSMELTLQILGITVTDNCNVDTILITPDEFDCFDLGAQPVTITATDKSGNSNTQVITVTFIDDEVPLLECPAGISRCADNNIVEYAAPVAIDNCLILGGTFVLVNGLPSGSPFPQGTTSNLYTYTDASGNTGACSFEVMILSPLTVAVDAIIHDVADQHTGGIQVSVLGSQPGYSYEWLLNGTVIATTEDLSGIGAGLYNLWVTDASGCKTEAGPFEVSNLVKTDNPDWSDYIAIYPNPASGRFFVVLPTELLETETQLRVFDAAGKLVLEQNHQAQNRLELDLTNYADGLYSILIRLDRGTAVKKIIIDR